MLQNNGRIQASGLQRHGFGRHERPPATRIEECRDRMMDLKQYVRDIPDFPKAGVLFRDITPLLAEPQAFAASIERLADPFRDRGIDAVVAAEARGFIFAAPLALHLNLPFVPIRKPGKLPFLTHRHSYDLEYGSDALEMHVDGIQPGQRVLVVDDVLATGGTVQACNRLVKQCGGNVAACGFFIELLALGGRERVQPYPVHSVLQY
jgi:adenine phosphoribosyltransferase